MKINFNEETHTYTLGEKELVSVTRLLRKANISPNYDCVNQEVLKKSAEYGSFIHKEIEEYIKEDKEGLSGIAQKFQRFLTMTNRRVIASELIVYDNDVAGTIDLVLLNLTTNELEVWDIKTTSVIHRNSVAWQDSIYAYLYEKMNKCKIGRCGVLHIKDNDIFPSEVFRKPNEKVFDLIEWYKEHKDQNDSYNCINGFNNSLLDDLYNVEREIAIKEAELKELENERLAMCDSIYQELEKIGETKAVNDKIKFAYVAPTEKTTFDSKRFKEENKELYDKYSLKTTTKPQFRTTIVKGAKK